MSKEIQAVFMDRDGTIGGTGNYVHPKEFELYPHSAEAIKLLKDAGIPVFTFTNQSSIAMGWATAEDLIEQFASYGFDDFYICPHLPEDGCDCRKPNTGMLNAAAAKHNLDLTKCVVIGDVGDADMLAAHRAGAMKILVRTGWGERVLTEYRSTWKEVDPDYVADDLLDAARWILA